MCSPLILQSLSLPIPICGGEKAVLLLVPCSLILLNKPTGDMLGLVLEPLICHGDIVLDLLCIQEDG